MQMRRRDGCPKRMMMGPCGGVRAGGGCEVIPEPCVFGTPVAWPDQNRPDFPPVLLASLLQAAGARPWMTLACRDRNRIVLEQELKGLRHLDVDAVLCVTGVAVFTDEPSAAVLSALPGLEPEPAAVRAVLADRRVPGVPPPSGLLILYDLPSKGRDKCQGNIGNFHPNSGEARD
jgi:methylenetetrahydrofolate reductase (NADPH)